MRPIRVIAENAAVGRPIKADAEAEAFIATEQVAAKLLITIGRVLPAGVVGVEGHFSQQEAVRVVVVERRSASALDGDFPRRGEEPREIGRALVNYGSTEIARIKGL